jgi:hypothetical protein
MRKTRGFQTNEVRTEWEESQCRTSLFLIFAKYWPGDEIKNNVVCHACDIWEEKQMHKKCWWENLGGREHLEFTIGKGGIALKCTNNPPTNARTSI